MRIQKSKCLHCKTEVDINSLRNGYCTRCYKTQFFAKNKDLLKQDFEGSSPTPFVGQFGYPFVNVGIMAVPEVDDASLYDAPNYWAAHDYNIQQVMNFRTNLVNSRFNTNIKQKDKMLDLAQEIGIASKPADVEVNLKQKPIFRVNLSNTLAPTGPNANLEKAKIVSNTKIDRKVEKVVDDVDFKANNAINYLYKKGFSENFLSKILSIGTIGVKKDRKLVPTRWSITAVDDNLCKNLLEQIKQNPESDFLSFFGGYLGNYYLIMMFPGVWGYELFEVYTPTKAFATDYEMFGGRKTYASNTAGGYYATRLGVAEKLLKMKKQSTIICIRFITEEYTNPLGVWVVREATRKSLSSKPIEFGSRDLMITYAKNLAKKKYGFDLDKVLEKSILLKDMKTQMKLSSFV